MWKEVWTYITKIMALFSKVFKILVLGNQTEFSLIKHLPAKTRKRGNERIF